MGDNSVDIIPPALDNGEPNSTMANQIAYSPKETFSEEYFCTKMVPSSCETKWCSMILCLSAVLLCVNCQQQMPYRKVPGSRSDGFDARNVRDYYIQAEKVEWNYLPYGQNLVDNYNDYLQDSLVNKRDRVGSKYSKYVYKRYTDNTYTTEIPSPQSQGYVGPLIKGEVGDIIRVYFRNSIPIPVSMHPHGVRYDKNNEGAFYVDNTKGLNKTEDRVQPGSTVTLIWKLTAEFAPKDDDPSCLPFAYHSHNNPDMEVNSGLLGLLLVCKQGILKSDETRSDVDKEYVLYFDSINEGESWLTEENLKRCQDPAECKRLMESGDPDFEESLKKDQLNGYMYGNLPGLQVCVGQKVVWYIFSLSAELHSVSIHGHTFQHQHHRSSALGVWSATFLAAETVSMHPGSWLVSCLNTEHNRNGMNALLSVKDCRNYTVHDPLSGNVRSYFLSAETEMWNYAPSGINVYDGGSLTEPGKTSAKYFMRGNDRIGGSYIKARFHQYTNYTYTRKTPITEAEKHLGILGPVIRAEVGDEIRVTILNRLKHPISLFLEGVSLNKSQDGLPLKIPFSSQSTGRIVPPGILETYSFAVPWSVTPGSDDPPCLTYMYYSTYQMERDVNSGLVGPLLICKPGSLDPSTNRQRYIDKEMFLLYSAMDENFSWYLDDSINAVLNNRSVDKNDEDFMESNVMRSINGRSYGNLEGLNVCKGERVVWHVMSFGQTDGLHSVTFNGNNVMIVGVYRDSHVTIPGVSFTAMMHADNVGNWSISCHNDEHFEKGMKAIYSVETCGNFGNSYNPQSGTTRTYYIAAVERKWDYSPNTIHPMTGENYSDPSSAQYSRIQKDGKFVGSIYTKALFREFTDSTFTVEKHMDNDTVHLGVLGPFIRAGVGDVIKVVFKNMATRPYSIHPQGLKYSKSNEGMKYMDGVSNSDGDSVPPGSTFTYVWEVPETSGPAPNGPNCVGSIYHSAVDPVKDTYSGLVGPLVVCRPGILGANGKRRDTVEREFALLFQAFNENESWYFDRNILENCPLADKNDDDFIESNKYDSINGRIYNNVEGLTMKRGDNVAWYILGLGESEDIHTVHFHGQTYTHRTSRNHEGDVMEVFPGTYETVEMFAENPGTWLIHCHVSEHVRDGMVGTYTIL